MGAPPSLLLSALAWSGSPATSTPGNEASDEPVGAYIEALSVQLNKGENNPALDAVEYVPATPSVFDYRRHAFTGTAPSEVTYYGSILAQNMPPRIAICLPGRVPWPERFRRCGYLERSRTGPPFLFCDEDWSGEHGLHPETDFHGLAIITPDLPGQGEGDVQPVSDEGREPDSTKGLGWRGEWATALLERKDKGDPLGERTEIIWNTNEDPTWGIQVRLQVSVSSVILFGEKVNGGSFLLQALRVEEMLDEDTEQATDPRGISDYNIRATILKVFVKDEELTCLQQPQRDVEEEEEEELELEKEANELKDSEYDYEDV
ncbi:hypothetical protein B0H11DRAFT_1976058 [Mycena galericulata]|nr:hypothetical protein B0H11DRAFT_1976058 [Mycena galericulata]